MKRVLYKGKNTSRTVRKVPTYMLPCRNHSTRGDKSWSLGKEETTQMYDTVYNLPELVATYCDKHKMFKHGDTLYYSDSNHVALLRCPTCQKKCEVSRKQHPHKSWKKTKGVNIPDVGTAVDDVW